MAVIFVVLILLAGCGGQESISTSTPPTTPAPTSSQPPTTTLVTTPTPTPTPVPDNPFGEKPIIIGIDNPTNRSYNTLVREVISYWTQTGKQHTDWWTTIKLKPDASSPDLTVSFISNIGRCGVEVNEDHIGCAPLIEQTDTVYTERLQIETGYTNASTRATLKHEFGHIFGLEHGETPLAIMNATGIANLTAQPNASMRAIPWENDSLKVHINISSFDTIDSTEIDEQVKPTVDHFSNARGKVPANLSIKELDSPHDADIVVVAMNSLERPSQKRECMVVPRMLTQRLNIIQMQRLQSILRQTVTTSGTTSDTG